MDCIDCHNRPTHLFRSPAKETDALLQRQADLRDLPFYKREVVKAASVTYPTHELGVEGVRNAITAFYKTSSPEIAVKQAALVARAAEEAARVYDRTEFPEMKTGFKTHPNNIGHDDSPGCFRCHDGGMKSEKTGETIPDDCETCHSILVDGSPTQPDLTKLAMPEPQPTEGPAEAKP